MNKLLIALCISTAREVYKLVTIGTGKNIN